MGQIKLFAAAHEPRFDFRTIQGLTVQDIATKLKLSPLVDDKAVKLTVELPAQVYRDLVACGDVLFVNWRAVRGPISVQNV